MSLFDTPLSQITLGQILLIVLLGCLGLLASRLLIAATIYVHDELQYHSERMQLLPTIILLPLLAWITFNYMIPKLQEMLANIH